MDTVGALRQGQTGNRDLLDNSNQLNETPSQGKTPMAETISNITEGQTVQNNDSLRSRIDNASTELYRVLTGQNNTRPAYAGLGEDGMGTVKFNDASEGDLIPIKQDMTARRVGDEMHLDGEPRKWDPNAQSLTKYRDELANEIIKNHGHEDNISVAGRGNKVGINADSAEKIASGGGPNVLDKRSELVGDKFDYMKYAEKIKGNQPDRKGKHAFADNWDKYVTRNVRFSDGDVADVYNEIANDKNGKGNLYTADYDITKTGSLVEEPTSGQGPYSGKTSSDSIVPQDAQNVNSKTPDSAQTEIYRALTGNNSRNSGDDDAMRASKEYEYRQRRNEALLEQYGTVDKPTAKATRPIETVGKMADMGFEKPQDVEKAAKYVTGSNRKLNILNRKAIENAGPIDTWAGVEPG